MNEKVSKMDERREKGVGTNETKKKLPVYDNFHNEVVVGGGFSFW